MGGPIHSETFDNMSHPSLTTVYMYVIILIGKRPICVEIIASVTLVLLLRL